MAQALGICIRLLENNRSSDSVRKYVIEFTRMMSLSNMIIIHQLLAIFPLYLTNTFHSSVYSTAAATFRQAVALIFDHVIFAESLPAGKFGTGSLTSRTMVTADVDHNINSSEYACLLIDITLLP